LTAEREKKDKLCKWGGGGNGGSLIRIFICQKTLQKAFQLACQEAFFTNIFSSNLKPLLSCSGRRWTVLIPLALIIRPAAVDPEGVV
jgi:hypothetical protein